MKSFQDIFSYAGHSSDAIEAIYDACVERIKRAKATVLSKIATVQSEQATRSVPPLREYIQVYVKSVAEAEAELNVKCTCNWPTQNLDKFRDDAREEIKKESALTIALLTDDYKKVYTKIATEVLDVAKRQFSALFEEMKGRELKQDVSENEFDEVDKAIRLDFERNYLCATERDLHWQHLINGPLVKLRNGMKEKVLKEVLRSRRVARQHADTVNADAQWNPDPILIAKEIEKSVQTLKEAVSYMNNALLRRAGMEQGFSKDELNDLMNTRWLELQDRLLERTQVRGTRYEDDVVVAFEKASVDECNQVRDDVYSRLVQRRYEEIIRRIQDPALGVHNEKMTVAEYRSKCHKAFETWMNKWTVSTAMRRNFSAFVSTCENALHWEGTFLPSEPGTTTPHLQETKGKESKEGGKRRQSYSPGGKDGGGAGGFSAGYNEGASAKRARSKPLGNRKIKSKGEAIVTPAVSTSVGEGMDVEEEAPARGTKRPASPTVVGESPAEVRNGGSGATAKKRRTSAMQSSTSHLHHGVRTEEEQGEEDRGGETKELSPAKRQRTSPPRVKRGVTAKLAPTEEQQSHENALERAKREAREELSRRAAEYVASKESSGSAKKAAKKPAERKRKSLT